MSFTNYVTAASKLAQAIVAATDGRPVDAARSAVDAVLDVVPHDVAQQLLSDAAVRRANAIANAAELVKFGDG